MSDPTATPIPAGSRRSIASFPDYARAQAAVDSLADREFPVEHLAIVGTGLRTVEQVTGRLTWGRVVLSGLLSGAWIGGIFALIFSLLLTDDPGVSVLGVFLYGLVFGAVLGLLFSVLSYSMTGGGRDFSSVGGLQAERYDVLCDADHADRAEQLLAAR